MTQTTLSKLSTAPHYPIFKNKVIEPPSIICDSNILFNSIVRDILIRLARTDIFYARWTEEIIEEFTRNLLNKNKNSDKEKIDRLVKLMNSALPTALLRNYQSLIPSFESLLPDRQDAHVLAAAVASQSKYIVTFNLKHFPSNVLSRHRIEALHPDEFLLMMLKKNPKSFHDCVKSAIADFSNNKFYSMPIYLQTLNNHGLFKTASNLFQLHANISFSTFALDLLHRCHFHFIGEI